VSTVVGCPLRDGPIQVSFNVGIDSKHPDAGAHVGTGDVVFQLYERSIQDSELQALASKQSREARAGEDRDRNRFRQGQCKSCDGQLALCSAGTEPSKCAPYADCVFAKGMTVSDCL
jgi:hypothetical protein